MDTMLTPRLHVGPAARVVSWLHSDVRVARLAIGAVALHVVDDNFLQPNPGTSAADHLVSGLVPLGLLVAAGIFYGRLRAGARAIVALLAGVFGVLGGIEAVHYTRAVGPSGDDYTGLLSLLSGLVLIGVGGVTLWRSRHRDDRLWWRYGRRALLAFGAAVVAFVVVFPLAISYVVTHASRATVPAADLGAPYEKVAFTTDDGLRLEGWYIRSRNGAAVISFPGRASSQKRAKLLARHGYGVLLFDRRGEGESEGDPNLFGWEGERDVHAAVRFLQGRPDVDPERIGGIGLSVGGEMMIAAAAESTALKAIVSEGASGRSVRDIVANPEHDLAGGHRQQHRDGGNGGLLEQSPADGSEEPRAEDLGRGVLRLRGAWSADGGAGEQGLLRRRARSEADLGGPGGRAHRRHRGSPARVRAAHRRVLRPHPARRCLTGRGRRSQRAGSFRCGRARRRYAPPAAPITARRIGAAQTW